MTQLFRRVAIIGVGMMGGSLGRALLSRGLAGEVVGFDAAPVALRAAKVLGAISRSAASLADVVSGAELVVLAAPVGAVIKLLPEVARLANKGSIITDVCSTKLQILKAAETLPEGISFVGGHPMAGSEQDGCQALDEMLFEQAVYILTPSINSSVADLETMSALVHRLGAKPLVMGAEEHDQLVGAVSHLPHLAATALVRTLEKKTWQREKFLALAAGGFRDTTRIAMGNPEMWKDICLSNRENVSRLLGDYMIELTNLRLLTLFGDEETLTAFFRHSREFRRQFPDRGKELSGSILKGGATLEQND
ncbi:MAG: prephenate dehydrogenase/arogenate dehydrogenase family protein [Firmicutes bacterium]|nr:prephenate dehydrogenase/arogenate dehydrogenase family protein [Bacillota bacterium]